MNIRSVRCFIVVFAALLPGLGAHAQLGDILNKGGAMKALGGQLPAAGSLGNVAGLLQFCVTNNYLGGEDVNPIQDKLMNKLPGGTKSTDRGYTDGLKGMLHAKDGQQFDLGGGMQAQLSRQICDGVLSQAKSLL